MTQLAGLEAPVPQAVPARPPGRGRWKIAAYTRQFDTSLPTVIGQLDNARGRRLSRKWNSAAEFTFTLDGHDPAAGVLLELATDIVVWRWDDAAGRDVVMFRGLIDHSEDQLSEQAAVVTFTAHDYFAVLGRRLRTQPAPWVIIQQDQDNIAYSLVANAADTTTGNGTTLRPGIYLPLDCMRINPDGTNRAALSGVLRDRTYQGGQGIGNAIDDLAKVSGGFDYDVLPNGPGNYRDWLRVFYPQQGVTRTDLVFVYGVNVAAVTRTVSSADYANYVRVIGNKASSDPNAPQLWSERWNTDANNVTVNPVGTWMMGDNASDVSIQSTLDEKAAGDLAWNGLIVPSYTLTLRPGTYADGYPNMGDTVPLVITEGRLNVNTSVRVVGMDFSVGEDGQEDVSLTVGRPPATMAKLLGDAARDIDALARR